MTKIRGKKVIHDRPMVMDAGFLAKNGNGKLNLKRGDYLIIIGNINFKEIKISNGAILEGDGVTAKKLKTKNGSMAFIKEADEIKILSGSEVHVKKFNNFAKIKNNYSSIFVGDAQLTRDDANKWNGKIFPAEL